MKAAVVHDFQRPLEIEDVPKPTPGDREVVVRIEAAGLCHTDIRAAHGDRPVKPKLPLIPGHEGVGIVESMGAGVEHLREGQRVAIFWLGYACGVCEFCTSGWETLCESQRNTSYSVDGSYAEYVKASAAYVVTVPDGIDPFEAAPLTCAEVFELHRDGRTQVSYARRSLDQVNETFADVVSGRATSRLVFEL